MHSHEEMPDLAVVGLGIRKIHSMTREAWELVEEADTVISNLNDPPAQEALAEAVSGELIDFSEIYRSFENDVRFDTYFEIMMSVLEEAKLSDGLVTYITVGHPSIWAYTPLNAKLIGEEYWDLDVELYAGVSASAEIYTLLSLDPARHGMQEHAVKEIIERNLELNSEMSFLGWLYGRLGTDMGHPEPYALASEYFSEQYDPEKTAYMVRASKSPFTSAAIRPVKLKNLANVSEHSTYGTTLVIPAQEVNPEPELASAFSKEEKELLQRGEVREERGTPEPIEPMLRELGHEDLLEVITRGYFDHEFFADLRNNPEATLEPYDLPEKAYEVITEKRMQKSDYNLSALVKDIVKETE